MYLDANNLYGWAMSQRLPVNGFEWMEQLPEFDECFIKNYHENNDKGYILEVDVEYPKIYLIFIVIYHFSLKERKLKKCKKLVFNIHNKQNYVVPIRALKQELNHGLILKKLHKVIQFSQKAWLKPYIDMDTKLRADAKNYFEKDFFKLMNNAIFGKKWKM